MANENPTINLEGNMRDRLVGLNLAADYLNRAQVVAQVREIIREQNTAGEYDTLIMKMAPVARKNGNKNG